MRPRVFSRKYFNQTKLEAPNQGILVHRWEKDRFNNNNKNNKSKSSLIEEKNVRYVLILKRGAWKNTLEYAELLTMKRL